MNNCVIGISRILTILACFCLFSFGAPRLISAQTDSLPWDGPGSRADREALFDYLLESTMARESFSDIKNRNLGIDILSSMSKMKPEFLAANTDELLFYALSKLSSLRKDRHLSVTPVEGGIWLPAWGASSNPFEAPETKELPVRFAVDYAQRDNYFVFVGNIAGDVSGVDPGDRLVAVNGAPFGVYADKIQPYTRWSTENGYWWKLAELISTTHFSIPRSLIRESAELQFEKPDGIRYTIELQYEDPDFLDWTGYGIAKYSGFDLISDVQTFDLYRHTSRSVLLLDWSGFREDLVADIDSLVSYARNEDILDFDLVIDMTRSRGGSKGAYAIQHLSPKPFKTTFGNLKLSDITEPFVERKREEFRTNSVNDSGVSETIDDGAWLMDWLEGHVMPGLSDGQDYSSDVPFKLAHAPMYSDGILRPAPLHFSGDMVVLLGPKGGSHLDQFVSIVADNDLGFIIGMPAGGYSNTWEWEETLVFPTTGRRIADYMWSIGHTIRPNGQVLEGNPADVDVYLPQTRENFAGYRDLLLDRAMQYLNNH